MKRAWGNKIKILVQFLICIEVVVYVAIDRGEHSLYPLQCK